MTDLISQDTPVETHEVSNAEVFALLSSKRVVVSLLVVVGLVVGVAAAMVAPGGVFAAVAVGVMAASLPLLAYVDALTMRLPNFFVGPLAFVVSVLFVLDRLDGGTSGADLVRAGATALGMGTLFLVIAIVMSGGLGMGDIKFVVVAGFVLGAKSVTVALFGLVMLPPFIAVVALVPLFTKHLVLRLGGHDMPSLGETKIAYGPYLVIGTLAALFVPASAAFLTI